MQPTNLFLPRLRAWSLSAAVGSGKTRAAVAWMASPATAARNVLYVAPTVALLNQTERNLRESIRSATGPAVRNVNLVSGETSAGRVEVEALVAINAAQACEGRVQLLTTKTFLAIVSRVARPELWSVICDEAFEPATFTSFRLGTDVAKGWQHFSELFSIDREHGHRIVPREGKRALVEEVARGDFRNAGDRFQSLEPVAAAVANPAVRSELVMTDGAEVLVGGALPDSGAVLQFSSYVDPAAFCDFREVLFLSALFERTILYALWTKALGVTFASHPDFPAELLRDTHAQQGRFLAVGHLLAKGDTASLENVKRDAFAGTEGSTDRGSPDSIAARSRVIDRLVETAAAHFGEERFLLQTNPRFGYTEGASQLPRNAVWIPPQAHGRNDFDHIDNVAALFIRNPNTQQLAWIKSRTGMTARDATQAYRIHSVYQALGRCSIRKAEPTVAAKVALTVCADDAHFLHALFPGSHWLGQVGTLPSLRSLKAGGDRKEQGKTSAIARAILAELGALDETVDSIKGQELKALVEGRNSRELLLLLGEVGKFAHQTWSTALSQACSLGSGWQRQGHRLVRVTAALYGFPESGRTAEAAAAA